MPILDLSRLIALKVKLTVVNGNVTFWKYYYKGVPITLTNGELEFTKAEIGTGIQIYVEAPDVSGSVGDIEIKAEYGGKEDIVNATGIWITVTDNRHNLDDAIWNNVTDPPLTAMQAIGGFGLRPEREMSSQPVKMLHNAIGIQFQVAPAGVQNQSPVNFDLTRRMEKRAWTKADASAAWTQAAPGSIGILNDPARVSFPLAPELPNDESTQQQDADSPPAGTVQELDSSAHPNADGYMYSFDAPGIGTQVKADDVWSSIWTQYGLATQSNFEEFARIGFGGPAENNTVTGSRASDYFKWHSIMTLEEGDDGILERTTGDANETATNEIAPGHVGLVSSPDDLGGGP